jgi:hypothetical protein
VLSKANFGCAGLVFLADASMDPDCYIVADEAKCSKEKALSFRNDLFSHLDNDSSKAADH